jgi:hypothetical protein
VYNYTLILGHKFDVTAHLFSSYVDSGVIANEVKQSHCFSFIDEIASATPRKDSSYSKKPEQLQFDAFDSGFYGNSFLGMLRSTTPPQRTEFNQKDTHNLRIPSAYNRFLISSRNPIWPE